VCHAGEAFASQEEGGSAEEVSDECSIPSSRSGGQGAREKGQGQKGHEPLQPGITFWLSFIFNKYYHTLFLSKEARCVLHVKAAKNPALLVLARSKHPIT
jgi:hypothetical protein